MQGDGKISLQFRLYCDYARKGKHRGYEQVGKVLVWHVLEQRCPTQGLIQFLELLKQRDNRAVMRWLKKHFPKHLMLVPLKSYTELLQGVYACAERLELFVLPGRLEQEAEVLDVQVSNLFAAPRRSVLASLRPSLN